MNPVTISMTIPGMAANASSSISAWVSSFYVFALLIGGVLAFGAIVYGGVKYTFAAGNPSGQSEGKEWIKSALIGLLLLASAYIILYVVNPNLVSLATPNLTPVSVASLPTCTGQCGGLCAGSCSVVGQKCVSGAAGNICQ